MKGKGYLEVKDFGILEIVEEEDGISSINFVEKIDDAIESDEVKRCIQQLKEYFLGKRREFSIKLDIRTGTEFQKKAWRALIEIPYGETRSYQEQAMAIGNPKAVRAVGGANNKNPISIIIPCHRVIGKNKKLVGYGGGLLKKEFQLNLEKENIKERKDGI